MRTELVNNRWLLCGHLLSACQIQPEQAWAPADGSDRTVTIKEVSPDGEVAYTWQEDGKDWSHTKSAFGFQCRYCLVLNGPEIPVELTTNGQDPRLTVQPTSQCTALRPEADQEVHRADRLLGELK